MIELLDKFRGRDDEAAEGARPVDQNAGRGSIPRRDCALCQVRAATVTRDVRGEPTPKIAEETCLPVDIHMHPLVLATSRPAAGNPQVKMRRCAAAIAAKPLADAELKVHAVLRPREVGQGAPIVTMDAPRWGKRQRGQGALVCVERLRR